MDREYIKKELCDILNMLDAGEEPELWTYISGWLDEEVPADPYELAGDLRTVAAAKPFPPFVFDFVVELYEAAIQHGDKNAMNDLGALYYDGRGCEQDYTKAVRYYTMAAEHGHRLAQENLGYCYYYGRNMPVDYEKAYHWFALGALSGMPTSLYKLGDMYQNGYYVEKNEREAFRIYDHCMTLLNDDTAETVAGPVYLRLGNAFLYGRGTEADPKAALICFQKAELYLFDMVQHGETVYRKSLNAAVEGQAKAREKLGSP